MTDYIVDAADVLYVVGTEYGVLTTYTIVLGTEQSYCISYSVYSYTPHHCIRNADSLPVETDPLRLNRNSFARIQTEYS